MFSFAQDKFAQDIKRLAQLTRKTAPDILKQAARAVVADACALTPPTTNNPLGAAGLNRKLTSLPGNSKAAEEQGKKAIARDVNRLFIPVDQFLSDRVVRAAGIQNSESVARRLKRMVSAGRWFDADKLMRKLKLKYYPAEIAKNATVDLLNKYRDANGRIRRQGARRQGILIANERSMPRVIRIKQKLVGTAKSGWRKAADMVGLRLPAWIRKHDGTGIASASNSPDKPEFTVGNAVRYIQRAGREEKIMERAIGNVRRNLPLQIEAILKRKARGAGFRAK
jgi:hypothetical protein